MQTPERAGRRLSARYGMILTAASLFFLSAALPAAAVGDAVVYPQDVTLDLAGSTTGDVTIVATSYADNLIIDNSVSPGTFMPTIISGPFKVRHSGTPVKSFTDGVAFYCNNTGSYNDFTFTSAHTGKVLRVSATDCAPPSSSGGGSSTYTTPFLTFSAPNGGQALSAGSGYMIFWSGGGSGVTGVKLSLSHDGGLTYPDVIANGIANTSYYGWTVPDLNTDKARVKVDLLGASGTLLSDSSDSDFTIMGSSTTTPPAAETPPAETTTTPPAAETPTASADAAAAEASAPAADSNSSGGYAPTSAVDNTPTINVDKELEEPPPEKPPLCESGTLIKGSGKAVYFCGKDGKRYVFPNQATFLSWFKDFSAVKTITDAILAQIQLGGNVTYRPGVRMVKIQTDPKVYAIARGGLLRWVKTEIVAKLLYGADWNQKIDDVIDSFFVNYRIGPPIEEAEARGGTQ